MSKLGNQLRKKSDVLKRPHITEKSSQQGYVFEVAAGASKGEVKLAVCELYKVTPTKVNILNVRPKTIVVRGRLGTKPGMRKAVVFLKKGDKIDFV